MNKKLLIVDKEKKLFGELVNTAHLKNIDIHYCEDIFDAIKVFSIYDFDVAIYDVDIESPGALFMIESTKYICPELYTIVIARNGTQESMEKAKKYRIDLLKDKSTEIDQLILEIMLALKK